MTKKLSAIILVCTFLFSVYTTSPILGMRTSNTTRNYSDSDLIQEFTWAVTRYDEGYNYSKNFGRLEYPKPSWGVVLVPTDMMCPELCKVALQVYHKDKMDTVNALVDFLEINMQHIYPAMNPIKNEWGPPGAIGVMETPWRKEAAHEMFQLGKKWPFANFIGDCYGLASFYTAVLRLCGFSPEEVFNVAVPGHVFNIVKVEDKWYHLDGSSTKLAWLGLINPLNEQQNMSNTSLSFIENDRYFLNFGDPWNMIDGYFNNMDNDTLHNIIEGILQTLEKPSLGVKSWDLDDFINNSKPHPDMLNIGLPYTVKNATGDTMDEKAEMLATMNYDFIRSNAAFENNTPNQYSRALYAYNLIDVEYPQVYANAAKYAPITSWYADKIDAIAPFGDIIRTVIWIRMNIRTRQMLNINQVAYPDLSYIIGKGSTLDQSVMAYGALRNMKKDGYFWQPDDLFVVVTKDKQGYLAVKNSDKWIYLNFGLGRPILSKLNKDISFVFNEQNKFALLP